MKIPAHAKKVFSGVIFDLYQWPQAMFDGTVAIFEMAKRKPAVSIIAITQDKNIIIQKQEQPMKPLYISIPGGILEEGEDAQTGAHRELFEETGYNAGKMEHLFSFNENSKIDFQDDVFIAHDCVKIGEQHLDSGEKITCEFVDFETFLQLAINDEAGISWGLKQHLWKALLDENKKTEFRSKLGL